VDPLAQTVRLDSRVTASPWAYAAGKAVLRVECEHASGVARLRNANGAVVHTFANPLVALNFMPRHLEEFGEADARWVGYLSYDLGRMFEKLPARTADDLHMPLFAFTLHEGPADVATTIERPVSAPRADATLSSNFSRDAYLRAVERAIEYIAAGDIFQVNLSQRFTAKLEEPPARVYERLRAQSPALYGAYLEYADFALLCNSPELFLRVEPDGASGARKVTTRPIKGTRAAGVGMARQLRESEKDQAELNMIIDLERNDLGRVCEIGSVRVTQPREIEQHPTVLHTAATVEGVLRRDVTFVDLLRATFPGGSITGAPKIRAMEIIEELEPYRRGPYCGAIGYVGGDGTIELNVAIRTMIVRGGQVHVPVGGGIVADSDPAAEYEETLVKARAMFQALGVGG